MILIIPIIFFLEITIFNKLQICGVKPELLLAVTVFFGFHSGKLRGAEAGAISGIIKDIFGTSGFGLNFFTFAFIGFISGALRKRLSKESFIVDFLLVNLAVYAVSFVQFIYFNKMLGVSYEGNFFPSTFCKGLYTGILSLIMFYVLSKIFRPLKEGDL